MQQKFRFFIAKCDSYYKMLTEQLFLSPQVKRSLIISNKYGIYELAHELPNDLRPGSLKIRKYQENLKIS